MNIDILILKFLNNLTGKSVYLDGLFVFLSVYLVIVMFVIHFLVFLRAKKLNLWFWAVGAGAVGILLKKVIAMVYFRIRPFGAVDSINKLIEKSIEEPAFPSGHTILAFVLAFSLFWVNKKYGWGLAVLALLVGLSRVVVGVHYPTDILGGIILAFLLVLIVKKTRRILSI